MAILRCEGVLHMITAKNVEKLIQIGKMQGDININGSFNQIFIQAAENLLEQVRRPSFVPQQSLTDDIVRIISKFRDDEILHISTCIEIALILLVHPEPKIPMDILFSMRPKADICTFLFLFPVFKGKENEMLFLREFGIDSTSRFSELFGLTAAQFRKAVKTPLEENLANKLTDGLLEAASKGKFYGDDFVRKYPHALSLQVDGCIASMAIEAFIKYDVRNATFFMGVREAMSQKRSRN